MTIFTRRGRRSCGLFLAALILAPMHPALAQQAATDRAQMPIGTLKADYLECARRAALSRQDTGDVMRCSIAYEELKRRVFDGDFRRLQKWTEAQGLAAGLSLHR